MDRRLILAHFILLFVGIIYGLNYIIAKGVLTEEYLHPFSFILIRAGVATVLLWITERLFVRQRIRRKHFPYLAVCGLFGVALNQTLFFSGLKFSSPINASLIMTTTPILVLVGAHWWLHERLSSRKIFGILAGMVGAIWLILVTRLEQGEINMSFYGDLMIFLNATAYAIYLILVKKMMKLYHPITIIKWVFTFGLIYVTPLGAWKIGGTPWEAFTPGVWWSIAYVVLGTTYLVYMLNAIALKQVSPTVVSVYIYVQPVVATIAALAFTAAELISTQIISGMLIFTGIYLVSFGGSRQNG